jgi:hypothetical protein
MSMGQELLIREVFRPGGGTTVLACEGAMTSEVLAGRRACLTVLNSFKAACAFASALQQDWNALERLAS